MLRVEKLICKDKKNHKGCRWQENSIQYTDELLPSLKERLKQRVAKTGTAHRIIHDTRGVLITIKLGYNKPLYIDEAQE